MLYCRWKSQNSIGIQKNVKGYICIILYPMNYFISYTFVHEKLSYLKIFSGDLILQLLIENNEL